MFYILKNLKFNQHTNKHTNKIYANKNLFINEINNLMNIYKYQINYTRVFLFIKDVSDFVLIMHRYSLT